MTSPISNHCHLQVPLSPGGGKSVSIGGGRSSFVALLRPPRAAPINCTLSLSASTKPNHNPDLSPIPPLRSLSSSPPPIWLLVPVNTHDQKLDPHDHYPFYFVSVAENTILKPSQSRLPWDGEYFFPDDTVFYSSSSLGWVLMKNPRTDQMFLINPLFPSDSAVPLPPIYNLDPTFVGGYIAKSSDRSSRLYRQYIIVEGTHKFFSYMEENPVLCHFGVEKLMFFDPTFAMSSAPSDPSCTVLVQNDGLVGFWKPGHKCWTLLKEPDRYYDGQNIVYSDAHQCFYVLDTGEFLGEKANVEGWRWDSECDPQPQRTSLVEVSSPRPYPRGVIECKRYGDCRYNLKRQYLVESSSGNLLLVQMYSILVDDEDEEEKKYETYFVFELNLELRKWEHVDSLGGSSLLVDSSYALCVDADNYPKLKPNCIYLDKGVVFNMDDSSIHPNYFTCDHRGPFIWLLPNPNS